MIKKFSLRTGVGKCFVKYAILRMWLKQNYTINIPTLQNNFILQNTEIFILILFRHIS